MDRWHVQVAQPFGLLKRGDRLWVEDDFYTKLSQYLTILNKDVEPMAGLGPTVEVRVELGEPSAFFEEDEPVEDVKAAFERGRPTVTSTPVKRAKKSISEAP